MSGAPSSRLAAACHAISRACVLWGRVSVARRERRESHDCVRVRACRWTATTWISCTADSRLAINVDAAEPPKNVSRKGRGRKYSRKLRGAWRGPPGRGRGRGCARHSCGPVAGLPAWSTAPQQRRRGSPSRHPCARQRIIRTAEAAALTLQDRGAHPPCSGACVAGLRGERKGAGGDSLPFTSAAMHPRAGGAPGSPRLDGVSA